MMNLWINLWNLVVPRKSVLFPPGHRKSPSVAACRKIPCGVARYHKILRVPQPEVLSQGLVTNLKSYEHHQSSSFRISSSQKFHAVARHMRWNLMGLQTPNWWYKVPPLLVRGHCFNLGLKTAYTSHCYPNYTWQNFGWFWAFSRWNTPQ